MIMTWDEAKEAMREGYLVKRPFWSGCLGYAESTDIEVSTFEDNGNIRKLYYYDTINDGVLKMQNKFNDFEVIEVR